VNFQKALPVITSIVIILLVAYLRDRSRTLAVILSTMPINITLGLWVIFGTGDYNQQAATTYVRALLPALTATMIWIGVVFVLLRLGVNLLPAIVGGYAVWALLIFVFMQLGWIVVNR
jgi:hypothetical protein